MVIGRGSENDVVVEDTLASRRHAILHAHSDVLEIEDLGSRNGTYLVKLLPTVGEATPVAARTQVPSNGRVRLDPGSAIQIGGALLTVATCTLRGPDDEVMVPAKKLDAAMRDASELLVKVAASDLSVLLLGETGVGKEVFTRRLHATSVRRDHPLIAINCGQTTESLLDSELFGHERGAFTGALGAKPGLLEAAEGGTFLLDEVGDMPLALQTKLLRVLQERRVRRIGATAERALNVRFVAATNRDLSSEIAAGRFRQDLFYRLAGMTIVIPPLRARPTELASLAEVLLRRASERIGVEPPALTDQALERLRSHDWPGNIRELGNVLERARVLANGGPIEVAHVMFDPVAPAAGDRPAAPPIAAAAPITERERIEATLLECGGNQTRAAAQLGITRRALIVRLERYGFVRPRRRPPSA